MEREHREERFTARWTVPVESRDGIEIQRVRVESIPGVKLASVKLEIFKDLNENGEPDPGESVSTVDAHPVEGHYFEATNLRHEWGASGRARARVVDDQGVTSAFWID